MDESGKTGRLCWLAALFSEARTPFSRQQMLFCSLHAPHKKRPAAEKDVFWASVGAIFAKYSKHTVSCLMGANARVGNRRKAHDLVLPSNFQCYQQMRMLMQELGFAVSSCAVGVDTKAAPA